MKPVFNVENVSYCAPDTGRKILDNISFAVAPNSLNMIIGPNGGGKSTILKVIAGLLKPDSGAIKFASDNQKKLRIAYVPQHFYISRTVPLTVEDFLCLGGVPSVDVPKKNEIHELLHHWGICHTQTRDLQTLSGGERQRVLMVRALLTKPDILLMDEPAQGLDIMALNDFYVRVEALKDIKARVIVSHDLQWVMKTANQIICLQQHICCAGQPDALVHDEHPILAAYRHQHDHKHDDSCSV